MYAKVVGSYTLDYITWTCPKCEHVNEQCGVNLYDTTCQECGLDIQDLGLQDVNNEETEIYVEN